VDGPSDIRCVLNRKILIVLGNRGVRSASLVAVACVGEALADFTNVFTGGVEARKERFRKCSTFLLIAALAVEVVCLVQTNRLSGKLIGSLGEEAREADNKARTALDDSTATFGWGRSNSTEAISEFPTLSIL
jgi:hypothetical protein